MLFPQTHHHLHLPLQPKSLNPCPTPPKAPLLLLSHLHNPRPTRISSSKPTATETATVPDSAIRRIADKLLSLGFTPEPPAPLPTPPGPSSPGEIFIPLPNQLPKHRVGHTIDTSWSTPEYPVPDPGGEGGFVSRFSVSRRRNRKERVRGEGEKAPTLAELRLPEEELRRLRREDLKLTKKLKVGKAGITEGIVNGIHERWRRSELVKIVCEDLCRMNMKRTHDLLEVGLNVLLKCEEATCLACIVGLRGKTHCDN